MVIRRRNNSRCEPLQVRTQSCKGWVARNPTKSASVTALRSSAGKEQRGPISKQRNGWLQTVLIEAAKLASRWNPQLAALHTRQLELGHPNRAALQVARKLVAYLLAVDKSGQPFRVLTPPPTVENAAKTKRRKRASLGKAAQRQRYHRFDLSAVHRPVLALEVTVHGS